MTFPHALLCDDIRIGQAIAVAKRDAAQAVTLLETLTAEFPEDARLYFLKGSLLVGLNRHIGAHRALSRAVELDPEYSIARFQLGFFELTSGEVEAAKATLKPLHRLPDGHYLRYFAAGLELLIADRFEECVASLRSGQEANDENEAMNHDMALIIQKCLELQNIDNPGVSDDEEISATSLLLRSSDFKRSR